MIFRPEEVRDDFPLLLDERVVYLDTAATAQKPSAVVNAIREFYLYGYAPVNRAVYETAVLTTERFQEVRRSVQEFIHAASSEEIVFTSGATASLNLVVFGYAKHNLMPGDEVLLTTMEHHANIVPWQLLAQEKGITLKYVDVTNEGDLDLEDFAAKLSDKTKIVSVVHASNVLGTINPIKEIAKKAHEVGALVVVDSAQSAPHMRIDVQELDVDFLAFSGHKLYGPTGIGVLYGKKEWLRKMRPIFGGGGIIERVTHEQATFIDPPEAFEPGTPNLAGVIGLGAALDYLSQFNKEALSQHIKEIMHYATESLLAEVPNVKIFGAPKEKTGIVSFSIDGVHSLDLGTMLGLKKYAIRTGNLCAQPLLNRMGHETISRISFGIYTTKEDIDGFIIALNETLQLIN